MLGQCYGSVCDTESVYSLFTREMHEMPCGKRSLARPRYMWEVILKGVMCDV